MRDRREKLVSDLSEELKNVSKEKDDSVDLLTLINDLESEDKVLEEDLLNYQRNFDEL